MSTENISINFKTFDKFLSEFEANAEQRFQNLGFDIEKRYKFFKEFFTEESINNWTWEKFQKLGDNLHSFQTMALARKKALGNPNQDISKYKSQFKTLLYNLDNFEDNLNKATTPSSDDWIPYFGRSTLSEIISYVHDDRFVFYNSRNKEALKILGIEGPASRKFGARFLEYNEIIKPFVQRFASNFELRTNTSLNLEFDQFMSWISDTYGDEFKKQEQFNLMIDKYKSHIKSGGFEDEIYKWRLIEEFKGWPNFGNNNFSEEVKNVNFDNLIYYNSKTVLYELAQKEEQLTKQYLGNLLSENIDLNTRIEDFINNFKDLFKKYNSKHSSHQDERTAATYLTFHDPSKYTFYKFSVYKELCKYLGIKPEKKKSKYVHYLEIINELISDYITEDQELIELINSKLDSDCYDDPEYLLLAQDIVYQVLIKIDQETNYWVFQGNPQVFNFESALKNNELNTYLVSSHKNLIKEGDKAILWITGKNAGSYALLDILSEPEEMPDSDLENYYLQHDEEEIQTRCRVKITHNYVSNPILKEQISDLKEFKNFKGGNQGTNFKSSKEEYEKILEMGENTSFYNKLSKFNENDLNDFFALLINILTDFNLNFGDKRLVFTSNQNYLGFIICQRAILRIYYENSKDSFAVSLKNKVSKKYEEFEGTEPKPIFNWVSTFDKIIDEKDSLYRVIKGELNRSDRSGYRNNNNEDFEKYIFQNINQLRYEDQNMKMSLNTILYGPPGTGKTYNTANRALEIMGFDTSHMSRSKVMNEFNKLVQTNRISFTTFHQSMSYEDFVEGIKPKLVEEDESELNYEIQKGIFQEICKKAEAVIDQNNSVNNFDIAWDKLIEKVKQNILKNELTKIGSWEYGLSSKNSLKYSSVNTPSKYNFTITKQNVFDAYQNKIARPSGAFQKDMVDVVDYLKINFDLEDYKQQEIVVTNTNTNYVLIIDEINRGNIASIFGELITLIEPDKRAGEENAIELTLPYSKQKFSVPPNLYIIGTMNTADRSVEALDTALRRRFNFEEMAPKPELIKDENISKWDDNSLSRSTLAEILKTINLRIEKLIDKDHMIGHSYFLNVKNINELKSAFDNKIIPLLQEYFFGDFGKIGLVLGKGFIEEKNTSEDIFAEAGFDYDKSSFIDRPVYEIINCEKLDNHKFINALNILLSKNAKETE